MEVVYYRDRRGHAPVERYVRDLRRHGEARVTATILRMLDLLAEHGPGLGMPLDRLVDRHARVYELRPGNHRIAYAEVGGAVVLLHAWRKQGRRLDPQEAATARARLNDWNERHLEAL